MTSLLVPRLEILPSPQRRLWDELSQVSPDFVLYGGTALALHLGHRVSVDFDFFGRVPFDPDELLRALPLFAHASIARIEPNTLDCLVDRGGPVKLSFFGVPNLVRLAPPRIAAGNGLRVASLLDLAGTKASVVQRRAEAKDYLDIDALLKDGRISLPMALAAARAIYGDRFDPQSTLKALCFFDDGDLGRLPKLVKDRLTHAASTVDLDLLPDVAPGTSSPL